jgi:hypothetical protein
MTITREHQCHDNNKADARRRRRRAMGVIVAGPAAIALLALFGTGWAGADETQVASGPVHLTGRVTELPANGPAASPNSLTPRIQLVDDDNDQAQLSENNAIQSMIQSEQQAQEQNDQAEQQFTQDELQAQQTEQEADQS